MASVAGAMNQQQSINIRWHQYCLNAYRVASGQRPDDIQHTLCEVCGGPSDEMDHRLAIEVARALGPSAMIRAFTLDNLRWLCRNCHRRKTRQDRQLAKFLSACSLDWYGAQKLRRHYRLWLRSFLLPHSLEPVSRQGTFSSGQSACSRESELCACLGEKSLARFYEHSRSFNKHSEALQ